jgi:OFA family oxalate/formate antiporter-like MFS transporter
MPELREVPDQARATGLNRWWRVAGALAMNLALGSLYAWSVFVAPLEATFGWKRGQTSLAFMIAVVTFSASFVLAGKLQDRFGPLGVSLLGGIALSAGFFCCGMTRSLAWLYFWFGMVAGAGIGFGYAAPIPVVAKWFPDMRGLAVGLAVAGFGAGSALIGPLSANLLIPHFGWSATFQILGGLFLALTLAGASLMRNPPPGWRPRGWEPTPGRAGATTLGLDLTPSAVMRTPTFWYMWLAYALGTSSGMMVISQLMPYATSRGLGAQGGSLALLVGAAGSVMGRLGSGGLSDHWGRLNVLRAMIGLSIAAMPLLHPAGTHLGLFCLVVFAVYWSFGAQLSVNASTAADFWGMRHAGMNYGLLFTAYGVAGVLGPWVGSLVYDRTRDYRLAFLIAAGLAMVALGFEMLAGRPRRRRAGSDQTVPA